MSEEPPKGKNGWGLFGWMRTGLCNAMLAWGNSRLRLQKLEGLRPLENAVEGGVLVVKGLVGLVSIMRPPLVQYFFAVLLRFR